MTVPVSLFLGNLLLPGKKIYIPGPLLGGKGFGAGKNAMHSANALLTSGRILSAVPSRNLFFVVAGALANTTGRKQNASPNFRPLTLYRF